MKGASLRRWCRKRLRELGLDRPFTLTELCEHLGERRGRPIRLMAVDLPADAPCGLWIGTAAVDYICYQGETSALHREHIVLHELGHMIVHDTGTGGSGADSAWLLRLAPHLDPATVRRVYARDCGESDEERQAEMIATLLRGTCRRPAAPPSPGVLGGLETQLGFRND